ncbi:hypothetical protein B0I32_110157 [Nonomuraea fuscirosea]|uniref:Uncharacterized protein n=1 Tax=Nonomuraea fuscirosea TaxID=1291556 RepID=A0A2T0MX85_9ACTN|nr:hypothetical protein [Nonomuraea fuscirosea]PRX63705.1 hypothetical protein B0I32_110157 [Nonomuraea fuscirosea]
MKGDADRPMGRWTRWWTRRRADQEAGRGAGRGAGLWARLYGAGPGHLAGLVVCFAVAGYAATRVVEAGIWLGFAVWFVGAAVFHDLVLWPLYSAADAVLRAPSRQHERPGGRPPLVNHVRVPVALSCLLLLVWFPLVLRGAEPNYVGAVGLSTSPYLARWLWITVALFVVSALLYAVRRRAAGRPGR